MEGSVLNQLTAPIHLAEHSLENGKLATAIKSSTLALENLHEIHCELLSIRIAAYQRQGNFSKAHNDAVMLQKEMPNDFRGYFYAAESLLKQEKIQEAIETCEAILPRRRTSFYAHIPGYQALWAVRKAAIYKRKQRMDPILKLPYDVIELVLSQLNLDDILCCMNVSKTWCHFILDYNGKNMNRLELIEDDNDNKMVDYFYSDPIGSYRAIQLLSNRIKELKIHFLSYHKANKLPRLLNSVPFHQLRTLSIGDCEGIQLNTTTLLKNSKKTLKNAYFDNTCKVNLDEILDLCPNLVMLHCSAPIYSLDYFKNNYQHRSIQTHPNLMHLRISTKGISTRDMEHILKRASNLHAFTIAEENSSIFQVLHYQYANCLRHICSKPEVSQIHDEDEYIDTARFNGTIDVHHCYNVTAGLLLPILKNQKHTEALSLTVPTDCNLQDWIAFSNYELPHLRLLKISFTQETEAVFANMVHHCPSLEEIVIHNISHLHCLFLRAVKSTLPNLRCFAIENSIDHAKGNPNISLDDNELRAFFAHYSLSGNGYSLNQVRLRNIPNVETATLIELVRIKSLKTIHIVGLDYEFDQPSRAPVLREIARISSTGHSFECLVLDGIDVTDQDIKGLDCATLRLVRMPLITTLGIEDLLGQATELKRLVIHRCENLDKDIMHDIVAVKNRVQCFYDDS